MELGGLKSSSFFPLLIKLISMFGVTVDMSRLLSRVELVVALYWDRDGWRSYLSFLC